MEVMPNVDYEKVNYGVRSVLFNNRTRQFLLESKLTTQDMNRVTSFAQFQKIFPGFYKVASGSGRLDVVSTWDYTKNGDYQIYYRNSPMDIYVHIEQWSTKDKPFMWRVFISTDNILAEDSAKAIESAIRQAFTEGNMLCGSSCDSALKGFLH
ncbi:hypothetical protein STCU_03895 [Strigomonas culicis]|nr:hypothetical protein STCU_05674 [Strigomonas culicis]EPY30782.1 hypothetical protein STCU_03895 [Strigomonas culicis]|eukprot:EPY27591.1 hypothetical protein STCU_05674 [Strigomonas culicis]